jgi:2,4-dienoyl-CoA reductase-like NADH-dependent reductase (Old Yellow Enzyme family)
MKSLLYSSLKIRDIEFRNRIFVSPMCMYSAVDGVPQPWHYVHLGSRAVGGAALVIAEATAVNAEGRISPQDTGIWNQTQVDAWKPIATFIRDQGAVAGIQLAHAGRKASTAPPLEGGKAVGPDKKGWTPVGPSSSAFSADYAKPRELEVGEISKVVADFVAAAKRALEAGFQLVELHMAHGYLMHEFLSPLTNQRKDQYGGTLENRLRMPLEVARAVREAWPSNLPLFARISATDWVEGGWDVDQSIALAKELKKIGVDLIDTSSGGAVPDAKIPVAPGYQVPLAERIRKESGMLTGAVGMITRPEHAEEVLANGRADVVFLARELLRDPYWPLHSAAALRAEAPWPTQYGYAVAKGH